MGHLFGTPSSHGPNTFLVPRGSPTSLYLLSSTSPRVSEVRSGLGRPGVSGNISKNETDTHSSVRTHMTSYGVGRLSSVCSLHRDGRRDTTPRGRGARSPGTPKGTTAPDHLTSYTVKGTIYTDLEVRRGKSYFSLTDLYGFVRS